MKYNLVGPTIQSSKSCDVKGVIKIQGGLGFRVCPAQFIGSMLNNRSLCMQRLRLDLLDTLGLFQNVPFRFGGLHYQCFFGLVWHVTWSDLHDLL